MNKIKKLIKKAIKYLHDMPEEKLFKYIGLFMGISFFMFIAIYINHATIV